VCVCQLVICLLWFGPLTLHVSLDRVLREHGELTLIHGKPPLPKEKLMQALNTTLGPEHNIRTRTQLIGTSPVPLSEVWEPGSGAIAPPSAPFSHSPAFPRLLRSAASFLRGNRHPPPLLRPASFYSPHLPLPLGLLSGFFAAGLAPDDLCHSMSCSRPESTTSHRCVHEADN